MHALCVRALDRDQPHGEEESLPEEGELGLVLPMQEGRGPREPRRLANEQIAPQGEQAEDDDE